MKVLHISPSYKPAYIYGGPTVSVSRLCEELVNIGVDVSVFTTTANGSTELDVEAGSTHTLDGVKVTYFKRLSSDHTHFSPALLWSLWKQGEHYDVIHIHAWWNLVSVFALLVCWMRGWKPLLAPRGMLSQYAFEHENSFKKKLIHVLVGKFLLSHSTLHATTPLEVRDCHQIVPGWRYFILPNIITLPEGDYPHKAGADRTDVLKLIFLSRVDPKKGLELLFSALAKVNFPFRLSIYGNRGDSYEKQLRELSEQLGLTPKIDWQGWVEGDEKFKALADADLFVLTSYNENFANVVLESLAVGTPTLLSDQVGMAEYVKKHNLGLVCKPVVDDIVGGLIDIYHDFKFGSLSQQKFSKDHFDPRKLAVDYLVEYEKLKHF